MVEDKSIPKGWEIKRIVDVAPLQRGFDLPTNKIVNGKFPVVYSNGIMNYHQKYLVKGPGVVTGRSGTIGKVTYVKENFWPHNTSLWVTDYKGNNPKFIYYLFMFTKLERMASGSGVPTLNRNDIHLIEVKLPTIKDQEYIVTVLTDVDYLIQSIEKLIDKKKKIKQGTMQQLLTGKKRLPGFSGEWEVKKLRDLGEFSGAGVDKKINLKEKRIRLLNFLDVYHKDLIYSHDLWHVVTASKNKCEKCCIKKGDVFLTPSSEMRTDIALSAVAMEDIDDAVYSYHIIRFRFNKEWDIKFKTYIFNTRNFLSQAETACEGSGKRYVISLKKFRDLEILYPKDVKEQVYIAKVLSDMDLELESLEQKLEKYKKIKQGMMQELLTGRIRLI